MARKSNYDQRPSVSVPGHANDCCKGWSMIGSRLKEASAGKKIVVVEVYPGVHREELRWQMEEALRPEKVVDMADIFLPSARIDAMLERDLTSDPVFAFLSCRSVEDFLDSAKLADARAAVTRHRREGRGLLLIIGTGATLIEAGDVLIYADMPRWEGQLRFRRNEVSNLGVENRELQWSMQYKRAFFVDWRVCDKLKKSLIARWDYVLDTVDPKAPKLASGKAVRAGLREAVTQPFRVVPFFDPAPWGGQWLKDVIGLDPSATNYGWGFDCVPEENSLLLVFGDQEFEVPSVDLVFAHPRELLGDAVHARFGTEFPIRFDFLDTIGGGNLSLQVHPLTEFAHEHFGIHYTQDESYYMLETEPDATVYLGFREGFDRAAFQRDLEAAQRGEIEFPTAQYANKWPAKKHDHFLIPAGTIHCSGKGAVVLEISATPYIFTFKLWDWGRLGLDGKPRPIHLKYGLANLQFDRETAWTNTNLVNHIERLGHGDGWREERTGLHECELIETRRHWFRGVVPHDTHGGVNVLNLVDGEEAIVESPLGAFEPFIVHYAETFIVPAAVGPYTIRPHGASNGASELATMKASVRTSAVH